MRKIWRSIFETWFPRISSLACKWAFSTIALAGLNRSSRKTGIIGNLPAHEPGSGRSLSMLGFRELLDPMNLLRGI